MVQGSVLCHVSDEVVSLCGAGLGECCKRSDDSEPVGAASRGYDDKNTRSHFCRQQFSSSHEQVSKRYLFPFLPSLSYCD